jgi:chromosome segregation ATPase
MLKNLFQNAQNSDIKPASRDLTKLLNNNDDGNIAQGPYAAELYRETRKEVQEVNHEASEVEEIPTYSESMVQDLKKEYEEVIEKYKKCSVELEEVRDKLAMVVDERDHALDEIERMRQYQDFKVFIINQGELNTKRSYMIRESTAKMLKKLKMIFAGYFNETTMNELADEAIQVYYGLIMRLFQEEDK